ncbi:MAG: MFS transporter [Verrucomicrobiota bacterium]
MASPHATDSQVSPPAVWTQVVAGALLMVATMPGRTHGLGLITEPLLAETKLSHDSYAQINLWATLLGSASCLPVGFWLDRKGPRTGALVLLPALALVVALMAWLPSPGWWGLAGLIFLTRALGQGALSVLSISVAGRSFKGGSRAAAGAYAALLSVLFAVAFVVVGGVAHSPNYGWRPAWGGIAVALVLMMPVALMLRNQKDANTTDAGTDQDLDLARCFRVPVFWIYVAGIAAFTAVYTGVSLFNQALLMERGFDEKAFVTFQSISFPVGLLGQILCGVGARWISMRLWLAVGLMAQAASMATYSSLGSQDSLWALMALSGFSGGVITVAFFSIWGDTFGKRHLGRIMGLVQTTSVFASAMGPLLLERGRAAYGGYAPAMMAAAPIVLIIALLHLWPAPRRSSETAASSLPVSES